MSIDQLTNDQLTDRPTDRPTDRQIDRLTIPTINQPTNEQSS